MAEGWGQYEDIEAKEGGEPKDESGEVLEDITPNRTDGGTALDRRGSRVDEKLSSADPSWRPLSAPNGDTISGAGGPNLLKGVFSDDALNAKVRSSGLQHLHKTLDSLGLSMAVSPSCPNFGSLEAAHKRIFDSGLTFSEAKGQLWELRKSGMLLKRGFRYRKLWVRRYVELSGRMLKYYEKRPRDNKSASTPRGKLELTKYTAIVPLPNSPSVKYGFNVIPDGNNPKHRVNNDPQSRPRVGSLTGPGVEDLRPPNRMSLSSREIDALNATTSDDQIWRFMAKDEKERREWIQALERAINLIRRVEVAPTLCGVGSVHYHYTMQEKIGHGRFGDVFRAVASMTEQEYAIKVVEKEKRVKTKDDALVLRNEIKILRRVTRELDHANICKLFQAYEDASTVYLVMENLSGGNVLEHLSDYVDELTEDLVADIIRQVACALTELHGAGIILCDIRPENLLYTGPQSNTIKVVEFGRAMIISGPGSQNTQSKQQQNSSATFTPGMGNSKVSAKRAQLVGDPGYIAPEVVAAREYSSSSDIWSLGCTLFTLLVGYNPFQGASQSEIFQVSSMGLQADKLVKEDWEDISGDAKVMVGAMLRTSPHTRISAAEILTHAWIQNVPSTPLPKTHVRIREINESKKSSEDPRKRSANAVMSPTLHLHGPKAATISKTSLTTSSGTPDRQRSRSKDFLNEGVGRWQVPKNILGQGENRSSNLALPLKYKEPEIVESTSGNIIRNSSSSMFGPGSNATSGRNAELLALDVHAERIRAQHQEDEWNLPRSPRCGDDFQSNFAPAGRFLNELESQMRLIREDEQAKLAAENGRAKPRGGFAVSEAESQDFSHRMSSSNINGVGRGNVRPSPALEIVTGQEDSPPSENPRNGNLNRTHSKQNQTELNGHQGEMDIVGHEQGTSDKEEEEEEDELDEEDDDSESELSSSFLQSMARSGAVLARTNSVG